MPDYYAYLLSSLPMLSFGMKPPLDSDKLIAACERLVPDKDLDELRSVIAMRGICDRIGRNKTIAKWRLFDTELRNELVKIRSAHKKIDPAKYLRCDGHGASVYIAHIASNAARRPSIHESEWALDLERWHELDELALGHYFDLDALIIYALKLAILEKWEKARSSDKKRLLEESLASS